jgi:DNA-binding FadR family transcriptional regulator
MSDAPSKSRRAAPPSTSRVEHAYRGILALITEGAMTAGARLPSEAEMATTFGVSRPVVRQALTRLEQARVVEVRWGAGSYVRDISGAARPEPNFGPVRSLDEVRQTYEFRAALEGDAAALAAERRPPEPLAAARRALDSLEQALTNGTLGESSDLEFHFAIAAASCNPFFERMLRSIQRPLEFSINLTRTLSQTHPSMRRRDVQSEHIAILAAIEAGDPDAARAAMRRHLANSCQRLFMGPAHDE